MDIRNNTEVTHRVQISLTREDLHNLIREHLQEQTASSVVWEVPEEQLHLTLKIDGTVVPRTNKRSASSPFLLLTATTGRVDEVLNEG